MKGKKAIPAQVQPVVMKKIKSKIKKKKVNKTYRTNKDTISLNVEQFGIFYS